MDASKWSPSAFGGPEVLGEVAARVPGPKPAEVTIDVRAVGVNDADYRHFAAGPRRKHLGSSIAGTFPFEQAPEALRRLMAGHLGGKLALLAG
jgi:hypothetical protein